MTTPPPNDTPVQRVLSIIDFDRLYERSPGAILINKYDFSTPGYSDTLSDTVFSRAGDIDFIARCQCDNLTGNYNAGLICPKCHEVCTTDMEAASGQLSHKSWIKCPDEIMGWLQPAFYQILKRHLRYGKRTKAGSQANNENSALGKIRKGNYLDEILDFTTPIPDKLQGVVTGKGFNYFYENFDELMNFFLYNHKPTALKKGRDTLAYFIERNRDKLFCKHLPILSSSLHSIVMSEGINDNRKRYVDRNIQHVLDAANGLSYLQHSPHRSKRYDLIETTTYNAYQAMIAYTSDISTKHLSKKKSLPRQHIFGSRLSYTFRGVITSIMGAHDIDELHMPWSMAVNLLRDDLLGRMMQRGMGPGDAYRIQQNALTVYNPYIDTMLKEFIDECPARRMVWSQVPRFDDRPLANGLACLFNRNPSIRAGSIQLMFITKIKTDVLDATIGFSNIAVVPPNADPSKTAKLH